MSNNTLDIASSALPTPITPNVSGVDTDHDIELRTIQIGSVKYWFPGVLPTGVTSLGGQIGDVDLDSNMSIINNKLTGQYSMSLSNGVLTITENF